MMTNNRKKKKLLNPDKKIKESTNKKNMKANVKKLWNDYATDRLKSNSSLKEHQNNYKKEARRKILKEGVMNTFFEYFSQGHTNEEIVQLYAGKGVNVPESFVKGARGNFEAQTKLNAELEMSELKYKNEASQIVNNPATGIADGSVYEDDKQLASGLFNEAETVPPISGEPEKEHKDVEMLVKRIATINMPAEWETLFTKLMSHSSEISGLSTSKIKALLMKSIKEL